jgi:hypothetical protein
VENFPSKLRLLPLATSMQHSIGSPSPRSSIRKKSVIQIVSFVKRKTIALPKKKKTTARLK